MGKLKTFIRKVESEEISGSDNSDSKQQNEVEKEIEDSISENLTKSETNEKTWNFEEEEFKIERNNISHSDFVEWMKQN